MIWIPGKIKPVDVGTKQDSSLTQNVQILFESGTLPIDFSEAVIQSSAQSTS